MIVSSLDIGSLVIVAFAIFSVGIPNKTIRYLARSTSWRIRYMAAQKNGGKLFKREISDYSVDMLNLMYWSSFYASLSEMMPDDRPPESIIDDDDALDSFMNNYFKEQSREDTSIRGKKQGKGNTSAWDHDETLVTRSNPVYGDVSYSETHAEKLRKKGNSDLSDLSIEKIRKERL